MPCSFCGVAKLYAKGLCKNCYCRLRRTGELKKRESPLTGVVVNNWEVLRVFEKKAIVRCVDCGCVKTLCQQGVYNGTAKRHPCHLKVQRPLTPRQSEYWGVWESVGYSFTEASKALGVSRQAVEQVIKAASLPKPIRPPRPPKPPKPLRPPKEPVRNLAYYEQKVALLDKQRSDLITKIRERFGGVCL